MAQLPNSLRHRQPATTSIHDKPPSIKDRLLIIGSWVLLLLAFVVLIFGGYALYQRIHQANIEQIKILGVPENTKQDIVQYLEAATQGNYFTVDLERVRDRTLELSWVDRVVVTRAWPDAIVVRITPRQPIARWGTGRLLSDDGVVFRPAQSINTQHLPLLHGPSSQSRMMMLKYRDVNQMFAPMNLRLEDLYLTERMTWFMQFDNGLRLIVDNDQTMSKLQRLSELADSDLHMVWNQIMAVDLRYRNGLAVQWRNAQAPKIEGGLFVVKNDESVPSGSSAQRNNP